MWISAVVAMWMSAVFALICFGVAAQGFVSLSSITDAQVYDDAFGFACFWAFLGVIAAVFGVISWMMKTGRLGNPEEM